MIFKLAQAAESAGADSMDTISCRKSSTGKVRHGVEAVKPSPSSYRLALPNPRAPVINFATILCSMNTQKDHPSQVNRPERIRFCLCRI